MKHIYLLLFMLIPMAGMAQESVSQDTTLYVNGRKILIKEKEGKIKVKLYEQSSRGDTIENDQIFEGIYTDGQTTERRTAFTMPFVKRKNYYRFEPHIASIWDTHGSPTVSISTLRTDWTSMQISLGKLVLTCFKVP